jgi:NNP family nitrate/nitrite transporter-like MFS transporter
MQELSITQQQFSSLHNAPTWTAVFLGIVLGVLADKFGLNRLVTITGLVCTGGLIWRVTATGYTTLFIANLITGFLACVISTNRSKIIGAWFKPAEIGMLMGLLMTSTPIAATLAMGTTALFANRQIAFIVSSALSVVFLLAWLFLFKEKPDGVEFPPPKPVLLYLKYSAKNPHIWLTGLTLFFTMAAVVCTNAFVSSALQSRGLTAVAAGVYAMAITIGNGVGAIFIPMLSRALGRSKPIILSIVIIGAVCIYFGWQMPIGPLCFLIMLFAGICIGSMMPIVSTFPVLLVGREYAGSAAGIAQTLALLGGATVVTYIIIPLAKGNFTMMYLLGALCLIIAGIIAMLIPETGSKGKYRIPESK